MTRAMRRPLAAFAALALFFVACKTEQPNLSNDPQNTGSPKAPANGAAKSPALLDPSLAVEQAPDTYNAKFVTTKGAFVIKVTRTLSPNAADRFYNLVKIGYYDGTKFFRAIDGFMVQFGINGDPAVNTKWRVAGIKDEPVKQGNMRGYVTFAKGGPDTRTTQVFINYVDNPRLDPMGFPAFGQVVEGMEVVDGLYKGYGEGAPGGQGPNQGRIQAEGNAYLTKEFPLLDGIESATIVP
jgi:peptidyl-prolyl cis-trans isomerase A (cyclophilin A)